MKYGLPYKGSKNKLATRIVELLPKKKHLVDLFCGGCAVTHAAMMTDKYEHIIINDLNPMCPTFFLDVLAGRYKDERRWISREEFHRLKATDPYVAFVWSFGNNLRDYLYGEKIEPLKRAMHYAIFFHDYEPERDFGMDLSFIEPIEGERERYLAVKHYMQEHPDAFFLLPRITSNNNLAKGTSDCKKKSPHTYKEITRLQSLEAINNVNKIGGGYKRASEHATLHSNLHPGADVFNANAIMRYRTQCGGGKISSHTEDYRNVPIPQDSVIYCDIPYQDTNRYQKSGFDYEAFYEWCSNQTEPIFISSYSLPEDKFVCVAEFSHRSTLSASANVATKERVFVPVHQAE